MSEIHDRVMVALANTPGKQKTVTEITRYVNDHFIRSPYTDDEIESALLDLADEKSVVRNARIGRWSVLDGRRRGSVPHTQRHQPSSLVKRVNQR